MQFPIFESSFPLSNSHNPALLISGAGSPTSALANPPVVLRIHFANPAVRAQCELLARLEPGRWYGNGELLTAAMGDCHAQNLLVRSGFLDSKRSRRHAKGMYRLTETGTKMGAILRDVLR